MESTQIYTILMREIPSFIGVFASDKIPQVINQFPASFVVNTDPSDKPGEHWVAFHVPKEDVLEFFDSYGQHPSKYGFQDFIRRFSTVIWNAVTIQSPTSNVCGQYCIYFLLKRNSGNSINCIVYHLKKMSNSKFT